MAASYKELQAQLTKQNQGQPSGEADPAPIDPANSDPSGQNDAAQQAVENAGLDFNALSNEWETNGALAPASYEALEKSGIPKDMVDAYIAGQEAIAAQTEVAAHAITGGADNYAKMQKWASDNLSQEEKVAFNAALDSDAGGRDTAIRNLYSRFVDEGGTNPTLLTGEAGEAAGKDVFRSTHELTAAMKDPRYGKDKAYTKDVEAKVTRSGLLRKNGR